MVCSVVMVVPAHAITTLIFFTSYYIYISCINVNAVITVDRCRHSIPITSISTVNISVVSITYLYAINSIVYIYNIYSYAILSYVMLGMLY